MAFHEGSSERSNPFFVLSHMKDTLILYRIALLMNDSYTKMRDTFFVLWPEVDLKAKSRWLSNGAIPYYYQDALYS
jgi:hypothetical protein